MTDQIKKGYAAPPNPPSPATLREGYAAPPAPPQTKPVPTTAAPISAIPPPPK